MSWLKSGATALKFDACRSRDPFGLALQCFTKGTFCNTHGTRENRGIPVFHSYVSAMMAALGLTRR